MDRKQAVERVQKLGYQAYFQVMDMGGKLIPWPKPQLVSGSGSAGKLPGILRKCGIRKVMVVTDPGVYPLIQESVIADLERSGLSCTLYTEVEANPTDTTCDAISKLYQAAGCDGFLAIGGGSPIDAAKGAAVRLVRPGTPLHKMAGMFKVLKKLPPIVAVPTTSGSGSETSMVSVLVEAATRHKVAITDPSLMPKFAVLDPELCRTMPPFVTATTGVDVLTHAVESYVTRAYNTNETNRCSEEAAIRVFRYLERAYADGDDMEAREEMMLAAFRAGQAFTRSGLGYVHAIAHALGGLYDTPHGLANAVILPIVLEDYGETVHRQLAHLSEITGIQTKGSDADKANAFIAAIRALNKRLALPSGFDFIKEEDVPKLTKWALYEGNHTYPTPVIYNEIRMRHVINRIIAEA